MQAKKAQNTQIAYGNSWRYFCAWCRAAGREPLPATPETVREFVTWRLTTGKRFYTVYGDANGIAHVHREAGLPSPVDKSVRAYLNAARRELKEEPGGKAALTYDQVRRIAKTFDHSPRGVRDRAMFLLNFASGWRRAEMVALDYEDLAFGPQGLILWQRSSKTDQIAEGRVVGIAPGKKKLTCPVRAIETWLALRGKWKGPLFTHVAQTGEITRKRLGKRADVLYRLVKRKIQEIGGEAGEYGAHSLRAGMITEAAKHGANEASIMQRTGHKSSRVLQRYVRPATVFDLDPLKGVL